MNNDEILELKKLFKSIQLVDESKFVPMKYMCDKFELPFDDVMIRLNNNEYFQSQLQLKMFVQNGKGEKVASLHINVFLGWLLTVSDRKINSDLKNQLKLYSQFCCEHFYDKVIDISDKQVITLQEYIYNHYGMPARYEKSTFKTTTDILEDINKNENFKIEGEVTLAKIGAAMKFCGFDKKSKRVANDSRKGYLVIPTVAYICN